MKNIQQRIEEVLEASKTYVPKEFGTNYEIVEHKALDGLKTLILELVQELHELDSLKLKEKKELEIISQLQK